MRQKGSSPYASLFIGGENTCLWRTEYRDDEQLVSQLDINGLELLVHENQQSTLTDLEDGQLVYDRDEGVFALLAN